MKQLILLTCALLPCLSSGQNLVLNHSLETYMTCPGFGQFSNTYIGNWDKPSWGSTDYYNYSCPGIVPTQQVPRNGFAYAGIIGYNFGQEYREYMTGTLSSPLIPGATYYCEFYVSLNDGYIQAIRELGAHFSVTPPGPYANSLHIPLIPQVENTVTLLDDTSAWMKVSGYFIAAGGEQYITIGNFRNDTNTTIVQVGNVGSYGSYYFVDDVWVWLSEGVGMHTQAESQFSLHADPESGMLSVRSNGIPVTDIAVRNMAGAGISLPAATMDGSRCTLDVSSLASAVYIAEIVCGDRIVRKKFMKLSAQ